MCPCGISIATTPTRLILLSRPNPPTPELEAHKIRAHGKRVKLIGQGTVRNIFVEDFHSVIGGERDHVFAESRVMGRVFRAIVFFLDEGGNGRVAVADRNSPEDN